MILGVIGRNMDLVKLTIHFHSSAMLGVLRVHFATYLGEYAVLCCHYMYGGR